MTDQTATVDPLRFAAHVSDIVDANDVVAFGIRVISDTEHEVHTVVRDRVPWGTPWDDILGPGWTVKTFDPHDPFPTFDADDNTDVVAAINDGRAFPIEKYEHSMVRYGLIGEASAVDRSWDVGPVGWLIADNEWNLDADQLAEAARSVLEELSYWANGWCWSVNTFTFRMRPTGRYTAGFEPISEWTEVDAFHVGGYFTEQHAIADMGAV